MEYSYIDIEANIRLARELRAQAMADFLAAIYKKSAQWLKGLTQHQLHKHSVPGSAHTKAVY
ncbi:hypothetical protein [Rhodoferax sp.]|uniref:hypothetical protein n=1 Tax=Rhodoferax sp. TaxID=50421 RepID=UPI0025CE26A3|nr:hypothetical protein [Rhodoferax sp.]MCM2295673.1 hypothetical protein [Rhodoferax sp.]MDD3935561.1 hypothetical protein [Rhodoferax sp.]